MKRIILFALACVCLLDTQAQDAATKGKEVFGDLRARQIGPALMSGRITDMELHPTNDRIIFLIDGRQAMTEKNTNGETHLQNSLTIALAVMKSKIIASGESSSIGLAFFGTKDRESTPDDTITSSKEGKDMRHEVALAIV